MKKNLLGLLPITICILGVTGVDALSSQVNAAGIGFLDPGSQRDGDTILDIEIGSNQPLSFNIFADANGYIPSNPDAAFIQFDLTTFTDSDEYFGAISGLLVFDLSGPSVQQIGTFNGVTVNPGQKPHDGVVDFGITLTGINLFDSDNNFLGTDPASAFESPSVNAFDQPGTQFNQVVELQQVPEPLTILGSATALGVGSLLKRKSSKQKTKS